MIRYMRYNSGNYGAYVRNLYKEAFPKQERFPWWVLCWSARSNNVHLDVILNDDIPVGMQFIVIYDGIAYLMYYAVEEGYRNHGIGGESLRNTVIRNDNVLLSIERPITDGLELRRKGFYLRNGFYETGCFIEDGGVEYEFLSSVKNFRVTAEMLQNRYLRMSDNLLLRRVIRAYFEADSIKFIS